LAAPLMLSLVSPAVQVVTGNAPGAAINAFPAEAGTILARIARMAVL
jgi:hypothetical protein